MLQGPDYNNPDVRGNCFTDATVSTGKQAVVDPPDDEFSAFKLRTNNIDLGGLVIQGASVGIDASDRFSGYHVHNNLIRQNRLFGMDFGSKGESQSRVDHNCFRDAASTVINGVNSTTWGLVSELDDDSLWLQSVSPVDPSFRNEHARALINAIIDHNSTSNNAAGLEAAGPGHHDKVTFADNVSQDDQISVSIQNSVGSKIIRNQLSPTLYGVIVGGANSGLEITGNKVDKGQFGIDFATPTGFYDVLPAPTTDATVSGNIITKQTFVGIFTELATADSPDRLQHSSLVGNETSNNGASGIVLQAGATDNTVSDNTANDNTRYGIRAAAGATRNTFKLNTMHDNDIFDARDDTLLNGKLQNTWTDNDCKTDYPAGYICPTGQ